MKWIESNIKPTSYGFKLVYVQDFGKRYNFIKLARYCNKKDVWIDYNDKPIKNIFFVTHWMDLPKDPK